MDMSRRHLFPTAAATGERLIRAAWAELEHGRAEAVDVHLASGAIVPRVMAIRLDDGVASLSTRQGQWTHHLAASEVAMVHHLPRGGRRD